MRLETTKAKEVNLLSIQYRMHPEISRFPSKMFYQSRLQDGPNMDKIASAIWHSQYEFPPYRFFNVMDGQEKIGRGKSIYNVAEADAAVALVDMLCSRLPTVKVNTTLQTAPIVTKLLLLVCVKDWRYYTVQTTSESA